MKTLNETQSTMTASEIGGMVETAAETIERYEGGLKKIKEYLESTPPRIGDATWTVEALLAR